LYQYYFDLNIAYILQAGEWNRNIINAFDVPFDSTASTPFTGDMLLWLTDLRVVNVVVMQPVGGFTKIISTDQVCYPIQDLIEHCFLRLLSCPILNLVSHG
jgi:hypothetical protein